MALYSNELRSKQSVNSAFLRFINNSQRKVDIVWIDYKGQHVKYKTLLPGTFVDANTFETHPWLFIDADTRDRLVVKDEEVFLPVPWFKSLVGQHHPTYPERTKVYITIPVFTLRQRALQIIRDLLGHPEDAFKLELPVSLQKQLAKMVRECSQIRLSHSESIESSVSRMANIGGSDQNANDTLRKQR